MLAHGGEMRDQVRRASTRTTTAMSTYIRNRCITDTSGPDERPRSQVVRHQQSSSAEACVRSRGLEFRLRARSPPTQLPDSCLGRDKHELDGHVRCFLAVIDGDCVVSAYLERSPVGALPVVRVKVLIQ